MRDTACAIDRRREVDAVHPAIGRALSAFDQPLASSAEGLARALLEARAGRTPPGRWGGSPLTGDGFPFELAFCTADHRLRFTVEPGAPDLEPSNRLDAANAVLRRLGAEAMPADLLEACRAMQGQGPLKYGAWISCRVGAEGCAFKRYVEVPAEAQGPLTQAPVRLPDRVVLMRMIGYSAGAETVETYARISSLEPRHVAAVLAPAGLEARAAECLAFIEAAYGHTIRGRLPGPSVGVSYVRGPGAAPRVTLHFYARALWGSDARIRTRFSCIAAAFGWNPDVYLRVTEPMHAREDWKTFHGLLGITLDPSGMSLTIGVRPVIS